MNENHFSYFKVENFKRFESFEMDNIGQFNLIVGDNNVGKTSVLEALLFKKNLKEHCKILKYNLFYNKNYIELLESFFLEYVNKEKIINKLFKIKFSFKENSQSDINVVTREKIGNTISQQRFVDDREIYPSEPESEPDTNTHPIDEGVVMNLIPFNLSYKHDLSIKYGENIHRDDSLRAQLVIDLKTLVPKLKYFDIDFINNNTILLRQEGIDRSIPLPLLGDGAIKLFRILIEIIRNKDGKLMIDEIDTGIHHKRLLPVWKTIIKSAFNNNVQIFATTHSSECLKFFRDIFLEDDMKDLKEKARVFRLVELKNKQVSSYSYNFEEFDHAIENENELR